MTIETLGNALAIKGITGQIFQGGKKMRVFLTPEVMEALGAEDATALTASLMGLANVHNVNFAGGEPDHLDFKEP